MNKLRSEQKRFIKDLVAFGVSPRNLIGFFEAPTGTGKTIVGNRAALDVADQTGQPVVISTFSNLLVQQSLQSVSDWNLPVDEFAAIYGMTNYVSPAAVEGAVKSGQLHEAALEWLAGMPGDGLVSDLERHLVLAGQDVPSLLRDMVSIDPGFHGQSALDVEDERIFYLQALERAQTAKVILTNHSVVLLPLLYNWSHLPEHRFLILDEGHSFAQAAQSFLSASFSPSRLSAACRRFAALCQGQELKSTVKELGALAASAAQNGTRPGQAGESVVLVDGEPDSLVLRKILSTGALALAVCAEQPERFQDKDLVSAFFVIRREMHELKSVCQRIAGANASARYSAKMGMPTYVSQRDDAHSWLRRKMWKDSERNVAIISGTVLMYPPGQNDYFNRFACTSLGIFDPSGETEVTRRLPRPWCKQYKGPFSETQIQVSLVEPGFPPPPKGNDLQEDGEGDKNGSWDEWIDALATRVANIYTANLREKTLVLLGSYKDVDGLTAALRERIEDLADNELVSAAPGRSAAVSFSSGVLIGTRQYWTGIDIPDIRHLVVCRLPFPPRSDPKWNTWSFSGRKRNLFSLYLWETVLMFRQGCGRLIRSQANSGTIHLLDSRIHKSYMAGVLNANAWRAWARGTLPLIKN